MSITQASGAGPDVAPAQVAQSVEGRVLYEEICELGISHVLTVPDTHQKTLLSLISRAGTPQLVTVCTEDEAIAMNVGLYIGGQRPMLLIQNNGLFACANALRGIALEGQVPTFMFVGQFARDVTKPSRENRSRSVSLLEPSLEAWGVPYYAIEGPEDVRYISQAYRECQERRAPVAVIIGARTS